VVKDYSEFLEIFPRRKRLTRTLCLLPTLTCFLSLMAEFWFVFAPIDCVLARTVGPGERCLECWEAFDPSRSWVLNETDRGNGSPSHRRSRPIGWPTTETGLTAWARPLKSRSVPGK